MDDLDFEVLSDITNIQVIARGSGVHIRHFLNREFGRGTWRKLKGQAIIQVKASGYVGLAEPHWFEAHGIGRKRMKRKRWLE